MSFNTAKLIIFAAALIIAGAIYMFFISPQLKDIESLRQERSSKLDELEKTREFSKEFEKLRTEYIKMTERGARDEIQVVIPQKQELPELLVQLEAIAAQTGSGGMVMRDIEFSTIQGKIENEVDIVGIRMNLRASYDAIKEYLGRLSRNKRLLDVAEVSFSAKTTEEEAEVYNLNLLLEAYFQD